MPFSKANPNRDRNLLLAALIGTLLFAICIVGYVTLTLAGRDPEGYVRFLSLLLVSLIPSTVAALRAHKAVENTKTIVESLNGDLDKRMKDAATEANGEQLAQLRREQ